MKDEKFTKEERIRKKKEFEEILRKGEKTTTTYLSIFHLENEAKKIGFIISKKIKKAVLRNKVKRLLREIYRKNKQFFTGKYIIYVKEGAENLSYEELRKILLGVVFPNICVK